MSKQHADIPLYIEEKTPEGCSAERTWDKRLEVLLQWKFLQKAHNPNRRQHRMHHWSHWKQLISDGSDRVNACYSIYCLKKPDTENKVFPLPALDKLHNVKDQEWGLNSHTHSLLSHMERLERLTSVWHLLDARGHRTQVYSTARCQTASPAGGAVGLDNTLQL